MMRVEISFPDDFMSLLAQCTGHALRNGYGQFNCELSSPAGSKRVRIIVVPDDMGSDPFDFGKLGKPKLQLIDGMVGKEEKV